MPISRTFTQKFDLVSGAKKKNAYLGMQLENEEYVGLSFFCLFFLSFFLF